MRSTHYKAQHERSAPTSFCSVTWSQDSYTILLSTLLPHIPPPHYSNDVCLLWSTVGNTTTSWSVYTLSMICSCVVLHVGTYKTENRFRAKEPGDLLRRFLSYPISFFKMLPASHQIGFLPIMGSWPYNVKDTDSLTQDPIFIVSFTWTTLSPLFPHYHLS